MNLKLTDKTAKYLCESFFELLKNRVALNIIYTIFYSFGAKRNNMKTFGIPVTIPIFVFFLSFLSLRIISLVDFLVINCGLQKCNNNDFIFYFHKKKDELIKYVLDSIIFPVI